MLMALFSRNSIPKPKTSRITLNTDADHQSILSWFEFNQLGNKEDMQI